VQNKYSLLKERNGEGLAGRSDVTCAGNSKVGTRNVGRRSWEIVQAGHNELAPSDAVARPLLSDSSQGGTTAGT